MIWLFFGLSCSSPVPKTPILLVTVDGLRADRVGAYGYMPTETPAIDRLADQGTKFLRAYTASSAAGPAQASILTGHSPPSHGMRLDSHTVASQIDSLPKALKAKGWSAEYRSLSVESRLTVRDWFFSVVGRVDNQPLKSDFTWIHTGIEPESTAWASDKERVYDVALNAQDALIGREIEAWKALHGDGYVVLVGTRGLATTGDAGEGLWLTDDWVRVPLIVTGPGIQERWETSDVVSTLDIATTLTRLVGVEMESQGHDLFQGGSELAYTESMQGWADFKAHPMYAFTDGDGRYIEGVYGSWHPGTAEQVRAVEEPVSGFVEESARLKTLRASFQVNGWDAQDADNSMLDLRSVKNALPVISKARQAEQKQRYGAARRILGNIDHRLKTAPLVLRMQEELKSK